MSADARGHQAGRRARTTRDRAARRAARGGRNLHDHLLAPVIFASPRAIPGVLPGLSQHHAHLFWRSRPGLPVPDTQPLCLHFPMYDDEWMQGPAEAYTFHGGLIRTLSRGTLRLRSNDPTAAAAMDPRALSAAGDVDALTASVALWREIGRQPALAEWTARELYPRPRGAHRWRAARVRAPRGGLLPPPGRHVPDGLRRRGRGRSAAARPRRRGTARRRCVDHAVRDDRQHERPVDDDRRTGRGDDARVSVAAPD
jgi:GMC oxidoreductase